MADRLNQAMHERSGRVHRQDVLIAILYDLLRDHVQPGVLEQVVRDNLNCGPCMFVYSNGWLAQEAEDIVRRIDEMRARDPEGTPVTK